MSYPSHYHSAWWPNYFLPSLSLSYVLAALPVMQTILTETGQFILQQSEVLSALGIPSTAQLQTVTINNDGTITFIAQQQISNTGSP